MFSSVRRAIQTLKPRPSDEETLAREGHREFVGGFWDELGKLQFDFLVKQGLKPNHVFLDIACGALRAGRFLIPYLEPGNYLGIDKHAELIEAGRTQEVPADVMAARHPEFVVSDSFEFEKFSKRPDFCIAQSLFTHLTKQDIELCFRKLSAFAKPGCRFFATYGQAKIRLPQLASSHSVRSFYYTRSDMEGFGKRTGWEPTYIGDWGHPRQQSMMSYRKI